MQDKRIKDARLINAPNEDPGLLVELGGRALLFDCGNTHGLSSKLCNRVTDLFVSHTHMDHFIGFDRLYRAALGTPRLLRVYGPPGIAERVHHRLRGYEWNLVGPGDVRFEVRYPSQGELRLTRFLPDDGYQGMHLGEAVPDDGVLLREAGLRVEYQPLDHSTLSFGYALVLPEQWKVNRDKLTTAGYEPGPWIGELLGRVEQGAPDTERFLVGGREVPIGELRRLFLVRQPPTRIAYVTDTRYSDLARDAILQLAGDADLFFCEAVFIQSDQDRANATHHLTAHQCGRLARDARVRALKTFHHSKRYRDSEGLLAEARAEYPAAE